MVKNDRIIFLNAHFGFCSTKMRINRARKNRVAKGVFLADRFKTAAGGSGIKKILFLGSVIRWRWAFFTLENYTFLCWLLLTKKPDEARDPDVMGNET
jgi:hypothetical protein